MSWGARMPRRCPPRRCSAPAAPRACRRAGDRFTSKRKAGAAAHLAPALPVLGHLDEGDVALVLDPAHDGDEAVHLLVGPGRDEYQARGEGVPVERDLRRPRRCPPRQSPAAPSRCGPSARVPRARGGWKAAAPASGRVCTEAKRAAVDRVLQEREAARIRDGARAGRGPSRPMRRCPATARRARAARCRSRTGSGRSRRMLPSPATTLMRVGALVPRPRRRQRGTAGPRSRCAEGQWAGRGPPSGSSPPVT